MKHFDEDQVRVLDAAGARYVELVTVSAPRAGRSRYLFALEEVSAAECCAFLNKTGYAVPPTAREMDYPQEVAGAMDHDKVYLLEEKGSNVVRRGHEFSPEREDLREAVNCATYMGAQAYCEWLSRKWEVRARLASRAEWQGFARTVAGRVPHVPVVGFTENPWEWCTDWWVEGKVVPETEIAISDALKLGLYGPKKVICGGKYLNRRQTMITDYAAEFLIPLPGSKQGLGSRVLIEGDQ